MLRILNTQYRRMEKPKETWKEQLREIIRNGLEEERLSEPIPLIQPVYVSEPTLVSFDYFSVQNNDRLFVGMHGHFVGFDNEYLITNRMKFCDFVNKHLESLDEKQMFVANGSLEPFEFNEKTFDLMKSYEHPFSIFVMNAREKFEKITNACDKSVQDFETWISIHTVRFQDSVKYIQKNKSSLIGDFEEYVDMLIADNNEQEEKRKKRYLINIQEQNKSLKEQKKDSNESRKKKYQETRESTLDHDEDNLCDICGGFASNKYKHRKTKKHLDALREQDFSDLKLQDPTETTCGLCKGQMTNKSQHNKTTKHLQAMIDQNFCKEIKESNSITCVICDGKYISKHYNAHCKTQRHLSCL